LQNKSSASSESMRRKTALRSLFMLASLIGADGEDVCLDLHLCLRVCANATARARRETQLDEGERGMEDLTLF